MRTITVDEEVYEFIKGRAEPFVDKTENDVLRKLLLNNKVTGFSTKVTNKISSREILDSLTTRPSTDQFVNSFLQDRFTGKFKTRSPYRMMFESNEQVVYFQNFNASDTVNLWYRLKKEPLDVLRSSKKEAYVCLTNPAEGYGFRIPLTEIVKKIREARWDREDLEVNIDPYDSKWRELSWNIEKYKIEN
jgi:hypothetical protein